MYIHPIELFSPDAARSQRVREWRRSLPTLGSMTISIFSYFTIWSLVVALSSFLVDFPVSMISIHQVMAAHTSIGGLYITYIYPQRLLVPYCRMRIDGLLLIFLDIATHHIPFAICMSRFKNTDESLSNLVLSCIPSILYISMFDVKEKYQLEKRDISCILFMCAVITFFMWL